MSCKICLSTIIATIDALGKSNGIQNLKITDLCGHLLFDSTDPVLLAGVDDDNDEDTSLAGVHMVMTLLLQECLYPTLPS